MKTRKHKSLFISIGLLLTFVAWTLLLRYVDVRPVGPRGSAVGFATANAMFHGITGVHMKLYVVTDWSGLVPICFCMGFAILGLCQWIKRRNILKVDWNVLMLGCFYIAVMGVYLLFEEVVINYRPVLIAGCLEASYPSSTTLLVMCVMPTAVMQFNGRIKNRTARKIVTTVLTGFTVFMVAGRLISGVHWLSDIIGGGLLSTGLVMLYHWLCNMKE